MARRIVALAAVGLSAWLVAPAIGGSQGDYEGTFASSGTLRFEVSVVNRNRKVTGFRFDSFPLQCTGFESHTQTSQLNFSPRIDRDRRFSARALEGENPFEPEAELRLKGRFNASLSEASGTMQIEGSAVPVDGGETKACDSGKVPWSASRL